MNRKFRIIRFFVTTIAVALAGAAVGAAPARALTNLKQVKVAGGDQVALLFDREVRPSQVKVEYLRDIIQVSIRDVSVYPAKILSVDGGELTKVFAYQYTPKLIRTRLSVRGDAEAYKGRVRVNHRGKLMSVHVEAPRENAAAAVPVPKAAGKQVKSDELTLRAAQAERRPERDAKKKSVEPDPKEKELLARVLGGKPEEKKADGDKLTADRPAPSPLRAFGWLAVMVGAITGLALFIRVGKSRGLQRRIASADAKASGGGFLSRLLGGALNRQAKLIEITAMHHLGPKKSIAVVKIRGRSLVIGITNDSINLITDLTGSGGQAGLGEGGADLGALSGLGGLDLRSDKGGELEADLRSMGIGKYAAGSGATAAGPAVFSDVLTREAAAAAPARSGNSARDRIRSKLRDMKSI